MKNLIRFTEKSIFWVLFFLSTNVMAGHHPSPGTSPPAPSAGTAVADTTVNNSQASFWIISAVVVVIVILLYLKQRKRKK